MSLKATLWALDTAPVTNPTSVLVLIALADEADDDGTGGHPSLRRIAQRARVSVNTAKSHIRLLEEDGVISVDRPEKQGRGHFNRYVLHLERGQILAPSAPEKRAERGQSAPEKRAETRGPGVHIPVDPNTLDPSDPKLLFDSPPPLADLSSLISVSDEFEMWWKRYPRNEGKKGAKAKFVAARKRGVTLDELDRGLDRYLRSATVAGGFVKHATTWLNGEHWADDPEPAKQGPGAEVTTDVASGRMSTEQIWGDT